ncbi:hypothetical protein H9P43_006766 [Blastocladiella emersonii ATCC 22665]|nr:hypothetical protein H9P43_006766 [Blastocladiella emersonii ATCC 22665]
MTNEAGRIEFGIYASIFIGHQAARWFNGQRQGQEGAHWCRAEFLAFQQSFKDMFFTVGKKGSPPELDLKEISNLRTLLLFTQLAMDKKMDFEDVLKTYTEAYNKLEYGKAVCKLCFVMCPERSLFSKSKPGGWGNLGKHMLNHHPMFVKQSPWCAKYYNKHKGSASSVPPTQSLVNTMFNSARGRPVSAATQAAFEEALVKFVSSKDQSISVVESKSFRKLIGTVCPDIKILHRTATSNCILRAAIRVSDRTRALLALRISLITLMIDGWTSSNSLAFIVHALYHKTHLCTKLSEACETLLGAKMTVRKDVRTRWWSTLKAIACVVDAKKGIISVAKNSKLPELQLDAKDWSILEAFKSYF